MIWRGSGLWDMETPSDMDGMILDLMGVKSKLRTRE